ncbi:MAG: L,D-transpeptidase [Chlamydiales bacterium]|nr:L,D-transpeptidase [Chlamydiia bacterium]MCP5508191.1 L,D-transpeptidase [Chlamydiales bacterium]
MNIPKILLLVGCALFGLIFLAALVKDKDGSNEVASVYEANEVVEIALEEEVRPVELVEEETTAQIITPQETVMVEKKSDADLPHADRIEEFFRKVEPRFPIVETISYKSRVPWQDGRPAWLSDYARHYQTSRHFIARSLNGKRNYFKQDVSIGDRFNVFKKDKDIQFHLLIDLSRSKMWFYYIDKGTNERVLVKTYDVGLGRPDSSRASGFLTPLGEYSLGEKVAIYRPDNKGWYNNEQVQMVRVFGTRWIPFECEVDGCTEEAKGYGIHGAPWIENENQELVEDRTCIGKYESDGCIRLGSEDMEELFAIVITKPTTVQLVKDYYDAKLPGVEK